MIVRRVNGRLLLIRQPDHAALAERVMSAWRADRLPTHPARDTILLATREHDNGWIEVDECPAIDATTRRPVDFIRVADEVKHAVWPRAVSRFADERPDVAALIAQHSLTVYSQNAHNPRWSPFFDTMERLRNDLLERLRLKSPIDATSAVRPGSFAAFLDEYRFLHIGDVISLIFCNGWTDPADTEGCRVSLDGETVRISPDPFDRERVRLEVQAREIPDRAYESDADLHDELARARPVIVSGMAIGSPEE